MGKGSRFLTAEREWHGKVGSHLVDGTGRDGTGRDGTGRDGSPRFLGGTGSWNGSGTGREFGREHSREIGRERSRVMAARCSPEWLGTRSGTQAGDNG